MTNKWIEEFVFRGRPLGSDKEPSWHVQVGEIVTAHGKEVAVLSDVLTMEEATKQGWKLPKIIAEINSDTMVHHEKTRASLRQLESEVTDAKHAHRDEKTRADELEIALRIERNRKVL